MFCTHRRTLYQCESTRTASGMPPCGRNVTRDAGSGASAASHVNSALRTSVDSRETASIIAKLMPMQVRAPKPNCMNSALMVLLALACEACRIEAIGNVPELAMAMHDVERHDQHRTCKKFMSAECDRFARHATHDGRGWIEAHRFRHDLPCELQSIDVFSAHGAIANDPVCFFGQALLPLRRAHTQIERPVNAFAVVS